MFTKNYHLNWIPGRANILSKYIIHKFFNFGRGFCGSFSMSFPKAPGSSCKKILDQFLLHCTFILMSSKSASQIFKILFKTRDINCLPFVVSFLVDIFNWKVFLTKNHQRRNLRHTFVENYRKLTWPSIKGKFHHLQKLELSKVIHSAKLHWKR